MENHPNSMVSSEDPIKTVGEARPCANKVYGCDCDQRWPKPGGGFFRYCCATCGKGNICHDKFHMRKTPKNAVLIASTEPSKPQPQVPRVIGTEVTFGAQYAHQYSGKLFDSDSESLTDEQVMKLRCNEKLDPSPEPGRHQRELPSPATHRSAPARPNQTAARARTHRSGHKHPRTSNKPKHNSSRGRGSGRGRHKTCHRGRASSPPIRAMRVDPSTSIHEIYRQELAAKHQLERVQLAKQQAQARLRARTAHERESENVMKEWEYRVNNYTTPRQLTIFPQGRCNGVADGARCMNALPATSYSTFCQKCLLILLAIQGSQGFDTNTLRASPGRRFSGDMAGDGPNQFHHHVAQAAIIASTTNCTSGDRHTARKSKAGRYTDIYEGIDPNS